MSHFTVLVIGENPEDLLAPFQENNMGDCPEEYMEFNDCTEEIEETWKEEQEVVLWNGKYLTKWNDEFKHIPDTEKPYAYEHKFPEGAEVLKKSYEDICKLNKVTKEDWIENSFGWEKNNDGVYGYYENSNAKWDWYQLGGRWNGTLKLKEGKQQVQASSPSFMSEPAPAGWGDSALKKDVDFEGMKAQAAVEANERYDEFEKASEGLGIDHRWTDLIKEEPLDIEAAREKYNGQPLMKALRKAKLRVWGNAEDTYFVDRGGREAYVKDAQCFSTFAVIRDGEWYEKGEMGMFGMAFDEKSTYDWSALFQSTLEELPDDTLLSVYDCHI